MTNNQDRQDDITRLIREGRRPDDLKGRMRLALDKFRGAAPRGVDAPNKTARKVLGGTSSLLVVLKLGFAGVFALVFGGLFLWAGLYGPFDVKATSLGVAGLAVGVFCLRKAWRAWGTFSAISRA
jgi:hypothetical protein